MIQQTPFSYDGIDGDIRRLEALLSHAFSMAQIQLPEKIALLNLACGRADESGALAKVVRPANIGFYLGMDLRAEAIAEARRRWHLPDGEMEFIEGNAAMIGRMKNLPDFDLVFIRHQNYWHEPMVWEGILEEALSALSETGFLACTSYFDVEHDLFLASMRDKGARLLANLRHPQSRPLPDAKGKSVDRHIAVFQKGPIGLANIPTAKTHV